MRFSDIHGADDVIKALSGMVDSGRVPHALMFHEDDGGGGVPLALAFLQYLMCHSRTGGDSCGTCPSCNKISKMIHPDLHFLFPVTGGTSVADYLPEWRELVTKTPSFTRPLMEEALGMEGKSPIIAVPQVKALLDTLSLSALEGGYRSVLVFLPEMLNAEAGNRLLKLIEEPPAMTQFVLVTHAPEKVLTTIRSRCQLIRLLPLHFPDAGVRDSAASEDENWEIMDSLMEALLSKDLLGALKVGEDIAGLPSRERQKGFCIFASEVFRSVFLIQQGMERLAGAPADKMEKYSGWAHRCRKTFPRKGLEAVSRSARLVERNVASKIIFTDLVDRLFLSV